MYSVQGVVAIKAVSVSRRACVSLQLACQKPHLLQKQRAKRQFMVAQFLEIDMQHDTVYVCIETQQ